ncbi:MAG: hypothetical protein JRD49_05935 [Deltaproteobacteria bacterium]|nr:hypothetical protein [Deltaproteobacteria bacterium]
MEKVKKSIVLVMLILACVAAAGGYLDKTIGFFGMQRVADANDAYLQEAFDRSLTGFLVLSGIKSGLAVIEGSEVGIGFNLEIGDIVQAVYDYVDIAWKAALAGGTILLITRISLEAITFIDHWCLALMLLVLVIFLVFEWFLASYTRLTNVFREAMLFLLVMALTLYFILPLGITAASFVSAKITQPLIQNSQDGFEKINQEFSLSHINSQLFSDDGSDDESIFSALDFTAKYEKTRERIREIGKYFKDKSKLMATLTIQLVAGYLFDCIIFPLTFFLILYLLTRSLVAFLIRSVNFDALPRTTKHETQVSNEL